MCWTFCWTKCWTLFLAKIRILSAISISSGDRLGKLLGDGAGEGNRTLVFSLEVVKFRNLYKGYSDNLQPSGRLRLLQNFSLSERLADIIDLTNICFAPEAAVLPRPLPHRPSRRTVSGPSFIAPPSNQSPSS